MARVPMVTRTLAFTKATVLGMNTTTCEAFNETFTVSREQKDEKKLLAKLKSLYETEEIAIVRVLKTELVEQKFGMTEEEFIKYAKEINAEDDTEETQETETVQEIPTEEKKRGNK